MTVDIVAFRKRLAEYVNRAAYSGERLALTRHGRVVAVVVSSQDAEKLEELETAQDARDLRAALAAAKRKGEKPIPLAEVKKQLGL